MESVIKSINLMLSQEIVTSLKPIKTNYRGKQFAFSNSVGYTVYFQNANIYTTFENQMYLCNTTPKNKPESIENIIINSGN